MIIKITHNKWPLINFPKSSKSHPKVIITRWVLDESWMSFGWILDEFWMSFGWILDDLSWDENRVFGEGMIHKQTLQLETPQIMKNIMGSGSWKPIDFWNDKVRCWWLWVTVFICPPLLSFGGRNSSKTHPRLIKNSSKTHPKLIQDSSKSDEFWMSFGWVLEEYKWPEWLGMTDNWPMKSWYYHKEQRWFFRYISVKNIIRNLKNRFKDLENNKISFMPQQKLTKNIIIIIILAKDRHVLFSGCSRIG